MKKQFLTGLLAISTAFSVLNAQCDPRFGGATFQRGPSTTDPNSIIPTPTLGLYQRAWIRFNFGAGSPASPTCVAAPGMLTLSISFPNSYQPYDANDVFPSPTSARWDWVYDPVDRVMIGVNNTAIPLISETFFIQVKALQITPGLAIDLSVLNWTSETNPPISNLTTGNDVAQSGMNVDLEGVVLPVKLGDFKATVNKCDVTLDFETFTEFNTKHFEIEHSGDGQKWNTIGTLLSKGNSTVKQQYSYTQKDAVAGVNYYRLKMVNKDGTFDYSNVTTALPQCGGKGGNYRLMPNPATNYTLLTGASPKSTIQVLDASGKLLRQQTANGSGQDRINTTALVPGIYLIKIIGEGGVVTSLKLNKANN